MDIKDLNKPQLILLVLLVSFVVSIATGVSVVSLMQQEPTTVTQTINKVIQHTIEKITVPTESPKKDDSNKNDTQNNTVIASSIKPLVDLYSFIEIISRDTNPNKDIVPQDRKMIGKAVVISDTGLVFMDASLFSEGRKYQVVLDKNYFNLDIVDKVGSVYIMQVVSKADVFVDDKALEVEDEVKNIDN